MRWYRVRLRDAPPMTEDEAQALHDKRREADPEHDVCGCWCCCWTCDFDAWDVFDATTALAARDKPGRTGG